MNDGCPPRLPAARGCDVAQVRVRHATVQQGHRTLVVQCTTASGGSLSAASPLLPVASGGGGGQRYEQS